MNLATPEDKVRKLQEALQAKAKGTPSYRFYLLYDKVYRADVLAVAFQRSCANGGKPGVDEQTFDDIKEYGVERWLGELAEELRTRTYQPQAVRRAWIPKPDGTQRPLGIPMIRAYCTPCQGPWGKTSSHGGGAMARG
jgi:retron-type reverse transcriptase